MITAALPPLLLAPMVLKPWLPPSCYSPPSVGSSVSTAAANGSSVAAVSCGAVRAGMCDKPQRGSHGTVFVSYTHPRTHTRKAAIGHQAAIQSCNDAGGAPRTVAGEGRSRGGIMSEATIEPVLAFHITGNRSAGSVGM